MPQVARNIIADGLTLTQLREYADEHGISVVCMDRKTTEKLIGKAQIAVASKSSQLKPDHNTLTDDQIADMFWEYDVRVLATDDLLLELLADLCVSAGQGERVLL